MYFEIREIMKQKKLMLLGGIRYLLPVIEAAHEQGYYVITADYIPGNIAHKYSDEYVNINITDKEEVLRVAREKQIDGIMSFGVDPGVVAASYVQNKMGLPSFGPWESVEILQHKDKFRAFLKANGFNVPWAKGYSTEEEALADKYWFSWPCIVKPTDSAGSKGVTRVDNPYDLEAAVRYAFDHSISHRIIIEEFIEKEGCSSDSDCFSLDGDLKVVTFSAQRFDENAAGTFVPAAFSWPSSMNMQQEAELTSELQRLVSLLHMNTSIYNIETRVCTNGKTYIMEVSPRGGGNRLAEMMRYATGVDMITACTRAAVGDPVGDISQKPLNGHWAEVILHAGEAGLFDRLEVAEEMKTFVVETDLWVHKGDRVEAFDGANRAIGTLVLRFPSSEVLEKAMADISSWCKVVCQPLKNTPPPYQVIWMFARPRYDVQLKAA